MKEQWCIPPQADADFVCAMEDVLEVYHRPFDPDRPVVTGRIYTNLQKTPYKLPDSKTQSGWKSNSTNHTGGYNEIMFEDKAGSELVRMQAEKDMTLLVKNDQTNTIKHDRKPWGPLPIALVLTSAIALGALASAAGTGAPGSMSAAHYSLVNGATAAATADTLAKRGSSGEVVGAWFAPSTDVARC